ncbi:MAG: diaminopimelate decarboxylase [Desulfobacterales bacterium]|nr:diaminopimelate decarboxylase [Desulfobacterales bacterium]
MNHFEYRGNELFCEEIPVKHIAKAVGTPFYLYSHATLKRHYEVFHAAFEGIERLVCYSAKANTNLAVLRLFRSLGSGLDIVSGGELYRGLKAGFSPDRIVYSGVGKRADEIDEALGAGILMFNVESLEELDLINQRAGALGKKAPIAIRVNPDVDPKTHPYISTGLKKNKFGIDARTAMEGYRLARGMEHVRIVGVDCHIGSQITQTDPFQDAMKSIRSVMQELSGMGITVRYLDMGGGLGITYDSEAPPQPADYARAIVDSLKGAPIRLILEPGRVLVGNAGILVTQVLYRKTAGEKSFIVVDAGMNDLLRPSIYKAFHGITPVEKNTAEPLVADVVGPICESGDFLAQDRKIFSTGRGDLLAVMSAGAYGFAMSSNYCSRLKVAEVMVQGDRFEVVRRRQTYADLVAGESVPSFLD